MISSGRRKLGGAVGCVAIVGFLSVALLAVPAGAWYEPANTQQSYWSPGPPPGSSSYNDCYVTTANGIAYNLPYAQIYPLNGYGSICTWGEAYLGTVLNGTVLYYASQGSANNWWIPNGLSGWAVGSATYYSENTYAVVEGWEASWLG